MKTIKDDKYYIDQVLKGDDSAFSCLVDRYKDLVFTLTFKWLKDRANAEEIAQDVFVKIYKHLHTFKNDSKFSTWIYRITYNTCLDFIKKNKKSDYISYEEDVTFLENLNNQEEYLDGMENEIQNCIDILPGEEAFLLMAYYYDNLSINEIAEIMNSNPNQIKVRLFRIRKRMASILRTHLDPEIIEYYERTGR